MCADSSLLGHLSLVIGSCDPLPQLVRLPDIPVRVDYGETLVQDRHHGHQLGPHLNQATNEILSQLKQASIDYHLLTGHALDRWSLGQFRSLSLTEVSSEVDGPSPVVDTDLNININILSVYHIICFELH